MLSKDNFTSYKHQSFFLKLKELAVSSSTNPFNFKMIFFGGTGAVGGQAVIEIISSFLYMKDAQISRTNTNPKLVITGINRSQIDQFCGKLFQIFGKQKFEEIESNGDESTILFDQFIELHFKTLMAVPKFHVDLDEALKKIDNNEDKVQYLIKEASKTTSPFEAFVKKTKQELGLGPHDRFRAVFSGIPVPSVATYHFESIDRLLIKHGIAQQDADKNIERSIKKEILKGLAEDFGDIKEHHSEEVLMAHTTSVGGMYQIINGEPIIKLGYAHSSLGDLLKEKQFYANELTIQYSNFNLKSLVTASAIGIDYIYTSSTLPLSSGVSRKYRLAAEKNKLPFDLKVTFDKKGERLLNKIFPFQSLPVSHPVTDTKGNPMVKTELDFGNNKDNIPSLNVNYALRSGENGLFSLDNAYALYLNMKIASQEELAHVLVSNALLGDDDQKPWFDKHGICYYTQTDNSSLIFALLNNRKEFRKYQTSAFTVKAFQELGSSKHQAELHTHGLFILMHKLKNLSSQYISSMITSKYKEQEVKDFVDTNTPNLLLEDVVSYGKDTETLSTAFSSLLSIKSVGEMAKYTGYTGELTGFVKVFFNGLYAAVSQTVRAITSLGNPIIFRNKNGNDEILAGPYFAPLDLVLDTNFTLIETIDKLCKENKLDREALINWLVCNNGFVDLRPQAILNTAKTFEQGLDDHISVIEDADQFRKQVQQLKLKNRRNTQENIHFNSSGLLAYCGRITGLYEQLEQFDLSLGTFNGWKALFPIDDKFNHILIPGLVEAMRHYSEGLGKITGTEFLYPKYGYFD
ncbi:hypothetical protein OAP07_04960 [Bacteroidia bacterium]|nr:hypothetical protein [Bacteroidia bacterium]MDC0561405.1 hypothetical protein [Bacteroidia bacterium]